jgi:hydroxyacylglutathione hydrolase
MVDPVSDLDLLFAEVRSLDLTLSQRWPMGDQTVFIPGHGPESTFGRERKSNPYVGGT